jgi:lipopolysaccharide/colanic/teichoic acid biosynthesis glycosyltransferase
MPVFRTFIEEDGYVVTARPTTATVVALRPPVVVPRVRQYALKRVMDFTLASLALVVSAPVWLVIACAIKLEDGGPVFYRQHRWGRHKKPFLVYKFRSMVVDADKKFGAVQAGENDPRFTRVGRMLRSTSLDEMPQLLNIWRGEMSWVGPRALPMNEKQINEDGEVSDDCIRGFDLRCAVVPGLTGIAQVFAPRDVPRHRKFRYDGFYSRRQSLWLDLRLIALSFWISVRLRWEDRGAKVRRRRAQSRGGRA